MVIGRLLLVRLLGLLALGVCAVPVHAATAVKVHDTGDDEDRLVWVIIGDGYTASEMATFRSDVDRSLAVIFNTEPWKEYRNYVNVYRVEVASTESGADHPSRGTYVDTAFDATYDSYGIERLLTISTSKARASVFSVVPNYDDIWCIINDNQYGGSGGSVSVFSRDSTAITIATHEYAHTFADLADEYETPYPGYPDGDDEPNVTYQTSRSSIPWKAWILPSTPIPTADSFRTVVGLFEGARYRSSGIYRPSFNCAMRSLGVDFCPVCQEAHVVELYKALSTIDDVSPPIGVIRSGDGSVSASVEVKTPQTQALSVTWRINNAVVGTGPSLNLPAGSVGGGYHVLTATVTDPTTLVRVDARNDLQDTVQWDLSVTGSAGRSIAIDVLGRNDESVTIDTQATPAVQVNDGRHTWSALSSSTDYRFTFSLPGLGNS